MTRLAASKNPDRRDGDGSGRDGGGSGGEERLARLGLGIAVIASIAVALHLGRDLTFWSDEFGWLSFGDDFVPETLLTPHNSHLIGVIRFLYELFPRVFGTDYLPFRLAEIAGVVACALLTFELVRRRVGGLLALGPAIVLLFFGGSPEVALSPLGTPFTFSIAFGLGALLAIEREDRSGDLLAAGLLGLSILSDTFGPIFAGGIGVYLLLGSGQRRRLWVAAVPLALYAVWYLWAAQFDQGIAQSSNLSGAPEFIAAALVAALRSVAGVGLGSASVESGVEQPLQVLFTGAAVLALALLALRIRSGGPTRWIWAYLAILLAFWLGIALTETEARAPTTPRYQFFAVAMLFLIAAEALRGVRFSRSVALAVLAAFGVCWAINLVRLEAGADRLTAEANEIEAQLGALELAGDAAVPTFQVRSVEPRGNRQIAISTLAYLDLVEEIGSLGIDEQELLARPPQVRADSDFVMARALGLLAVPAPEAGPESPGACRELAASTRFELPPGGHLIKLDRGGPETLTLGRFGDAASAPVGAVGSAGYSALLIPPDGASTVWFAELGEPATICDGGAAEG